ncbi:hypothetical protein ABIA39_007460 [Nocardia sp. GAS34]|uniref:hypothetical protein n=1 Tax=unclassified Nocardia TaxID=2637762 RepID=UPI003D1F052F
MGVFALIAAAWCGVVLGYAATLTGFPIPGAILVGAAGAALAVMQLSGKAPGAERH